MNIKNNKNCKITINDEEIAVSEKEKTSDELFDDLGLWLERETPFDFEVKNDDDKVIKFNKERREIACFNYYDGFEYLTLQELQAINKKCKELRLDMIKINNLKESIEYLKKLNINNPNRYYGKEKIDMLDYNIDEGSLSIDWYKAILEKVKPYNPKRVIDIGSNINLFGYLFANEGIEYIGIDIYKDVEPIQTNNIKFINSDYYKIREQFKNDICISCLCVGYLIPIKDVICRRLIIDSSEGTNENYKCTEKEIFNV